jgi:hypothetical protein
MSKKGKVITKSVISHSGMVRITERLEQLLITDYSLLIF